MKKPPTTTDDPHDAHTPTQDSFERGADASIEAIDASSPPPFDAPMGVVTPPAAKAPQTYSFKKVMEESEGDVVMHTRIVVDRQLRVMTWLAVLLAISTAATTVVIAFYYMSR